MNDSILLLTLEKSCATAIAWVTQQAGLAGMQVVRTFYLQGESRPGGDCPCPHHGTDHCDCQMAVLLVYGPEGGPLSLLAHGHGDMTWIYLADAPGRGHDLELEKSFRLALPVVEYTSSFQNGDNL